jgi:nitrate reductase gamma subunit
MTDRRRVLGLIVAGAGLVLLLPRPALAYLGPGGAVSAVGTAVALIVAVLIAIFGFLWFPLRRLMRRRHERDDSSIAPDATDHQPPPPGPREPGPK